MGPVDAAPGVTVTLVFSTKPREVRLQTLHLPAGSCLGHALKAGGWMEDASGLAGLRVGIWGKVQPLHTVLRQGDRIELYRPLRCDPKAARRERYRQKKAGPLQIS